ncbi:UvrB/UvrC motif-containing protein [Thermosyntropha sp.]|uniref:UvrB/UvrC motif-containing protein n=1 Tax=Thermosyntropha sp. TaxID=2740820 RepID=UPI0025EC4EC5|nr:UvrB/UvrC motif-containing protein [Thermosyntropha sp.]MBO8158005.1 UvrB/UvrC motif-containing protein [Thermosyntropha sp.]
MYCDECKIRPATVHLTQIINGQMIQMHLCEQCAAKKGASVFNSADTGFSIPNLLGTLFSNVYNVQGISSPAVSSVSCPNCGMDFERIRQTGKLGCSECYFTFERELEPTLRRVHGNSQHIGKVPRRGGGKVMLKKKIEELKNRLQRAVAREEYEKAAEIRDEIKRLEKEME